ncbi:ParA family protein [Rubellicoccus peritrichatus]|uniref:AAA family ATPase n=1 Tax=Rubellicoccus peritrichatus TaxID=3080537 RepID=A0AAQ3QXT3_9BACT|nr:AAA family ATPase [Puniceicoccus sp. CR14]WOO43367.1 AAA family ATPase [Puniceicoccus sp. CR14]
MKVLSIYNIKGGVGKTASAVNLSYLASQDGLRTLLCDFDPQGASSYYLRIKSGNKMKPAKLLKGGNFAHKQIKESDYPNLDLLPAHLAYRNFDLLLDKQKRSNRRLREFLDSFSEDYDLIIVDAPPNITLLSENIFRASDLILIPVIPTTLSILTYQQIRKFFKKEKIAFNRVRAFFSMVEKRKKLHRETIEQMQAEDDHFLPVQIPMASVVERMGLHREPVPAYAASSPASKTYSELWKSVSKILDD